jgi:hypothetical protein
LHHFDKYCHIQKKGEEMSYRKKIQPIIFIVFILFLFSIAHTSLANNLFSIPTGVLHGTITDNETQQPVTDVRIEVGNFATYSESNGYYRFSFIPEGSYNVAVFAPHYNLQLYRGLQIEADQTSELNISMRKNYQPVVYTGSASMITCNTAMFNGSVNPNGLHTTAYFEYGPSQTYGKKTNSINAGNAWDPVSINMRIDQLDPETPYHFRLVAQNNDGTTFGNDQIFATDVPILDVENFQTIEIPSDQAIVKPFIIQNQGCGPLTYNLSVSDAMAISPDTNRTYPEIVIPEITEGTIDSGLTHTIPMTYTAKKLPYGKYQVTLTLHHNALNYPNPLEMTIPIRITSPKITVNPKSFSFVVQKGNIKKDIITIGNSGNTDLAWRMGVSGGAQNNKYPAHYYETIDKDQIDNRMGHMSANHFGGPDEFGYMWSDSFANDGPTYDWFNITRSGIKISDLKDDDFTGPIDIGFPFPYYGQTYETFFVSSNGFIGFGESSNYANHTNMPIPSEQTPNNFIAPLWDDLSPENGGIYYYRQRNKLIVQFDNMKEYRNDGSATFQIIIDKDGTILFQYKHFTNAFNTNSCTTGIENKEGTVGLEVAFNMNYLVDQMAIRFAPNQCSWLKIYQSAEGYLSPAQQIDVSIGADTTNLMLDHYRCNFIVSSDDILNPEIIVPVLLDVVDAPPVIDITPRQLTFELMENEQDHKKLSIMNKGMHPLVWNLTTSCSLSNNNSYSWLDSDKPGGPIFDWIDISSNGIQVDSLKDDNYAGPFPIGFSFPFYGELYDNFYISSNGLIGFGDTTGLSERANESIPEKRAPNNYLAWFWDDLTPRNANVKYKTIGKKLVISFIDYGQFGNTGTLTAQVIINEDGSILYQYDHFRDGIHTNNSTIGIENKQGNDGILVAHNKTYLHDAHAIRFQNNPCAWLHTDPMSGTIAPQSTDSIDVHANAKGVSQGEYDAILRIESNDNNNSPIDIPVHLIVKGQSHPPVIDSKIESPQSNDQIYATTFPIKGTASATEQETIERVEISFDSGQTWKMATGTNKWRYEWSVPSEAGQYSICVRAIGHSGDYQVKWTYTQVRVISRSTSRIMIVDKALSVNDSPFQVKGVGYSPTPIGHDPEIRSNYGDYFTSDDHKIHERDFPLLRTMGANTLRLWSWKTSADHTHFLDAAYNNGEDPLFVIAGFWINAGLNVDPNDPENDRERIKQDFLDMVSIHMNHPAILMWCIGNELNADWMYGQHLDDIFSLINEMALAAKQLEGRTYHPTTTPLMDIHLNNIFSSYDTKMPGLSVWGVNVYRGKSFGDLFSSYGGASEKPIIVLEFGIDALDNTTQQEYEQNGTSEQSEYARSLWREIDQNKTICIGASIMAYSDEWWKGKHSLDPLCKDDDPTFHGLCGYSSGAHPDRYSNEEWWGIMRVIKNGNDIDKVQPRNLYYELQKEWNFNPVPPNEIKIIPSECERSDNFGRSVAIYGNYAAGGAKGDDDKGGNAGAVYMLRYNGKTWVQDQKITPDDGRINDYFGCDVAIYKKNALFGSYGNDDAGSKAGAAYIYSLDSSGWKQRQKLTADNAQSNDYFAYAVDISEKYAIIGAYGDDEKGNMAGAAYIFELQDDNTWIQKQKLVDAQGERNDQFGYAVAITENFAIVGAYRDDDNGDSSGSATIYMRDQGMWTVQAKLLANDGQANDYFGYDVTISGDYAVVGAYRCDDVSRNNVGGAYIYKYERGTWNFQTKLVPIQGTSNDYFGAAVDLVGTRLLVGAYGNDDKGSTSGAAYLYILEGDQWSMLKKYMPGDGIAYDYFAYDIAIGDQGLIMGAYGRDDNGSMAGAVYIYGQGDENNDLNDVRANNGFEKGIHNKNKFVSKDSIQTIRFIPQRQTNPLETDITKEIDNSIENIQSNLHIEITNMPPIGNRIQNLEGKVTPFDIKEYTIYVAIFVNEQWRIKPGNNRSNGMQVHDDGTFSCDITTAPMDHLAEQIAILVVPVSVKYEDISDIERSPAIGRRIFMR